MNFIDAPRYGGVFPKCHTPFLCVLHLNPDFWRKFCVNFRLISGFKLRFAKKVSSENECNTPRGTQAGEVNLGTVSHFRIFRVFYPPVPRKFERKHTAHDSLRGCNTKMCNTRNFSGNSGFSGVCKMCKNMHTFCRVSFSAVSGLKLSCCSQKIDVFREKWG